jgi:hypothetical protein
MFIVLALPCSTLQKWLQLRACLHKWCVDRDFEIGIVGNLEGHVLEFQMPCDGMLQDFATIQRTTRLMLLPTATKFWADLCATPQ